MDGPDNLTSMNKRNRHPSVNSAHDNDLDDTPLFTRVSSMKVLSPSTPGHRPPSLKNKTRNLMRDVLPESINPTKYQSHTSMDSVAPASLDSYDGKTEEEQKHVLSLLTSALFASVLEDTATQLRILTECNNELRIKKTMADISTLLVKKFGIEQKTFSDELEGVNRENLRSDKYKLYKLAADRRLCNETIMSTYLDLALKRNFDALSNINRSLRDKDQYCYNLTEDEAKNKITRRELYKKLRLQRNHQKTVLYETDLNIENIRSQLEDALLVANTRERYMVNWQGARAEQNLQIINNKEAGSSDNIILYRKNLEHESRVHTEVEILTNISITETLHKVEEWMDKYDADIEEMDLKIQLKKNDYKTQISIRQDLEETLATHEKLMTDWVNFKTEREKLRQYNLKMTNAAVVVQAWWRGLLVRLQLGPFKPMKKGRGAKKK